MKLKNIYKKLSITPNLIEHMLRVCGIVLFIEKHWKGNSANWDLVKKAALVHDVGNIVKFNLDKYPQFLGDEQKNIDYWKALQKQTIEKYGTDDHGATRQMLTDIGMDKEIIEGVLNKSFGNSVEIKNGDNWLVKILLYADLRALPFNVGSLEERLTDIRSRMPQYTGRPDFEDLLGAARDIEKQIQENLDVPVSKINDNSVKIDRSLLNLSF